MCTVAIARPAVGHRTKRGHDRFRRGWHPKPALPVPLDPQSPVVQTLRPGAENLAAQRVHALPNTKLRFLERRRAGRGSKRLTTDRDQLRQRLQNPSRQAGKIDGRAGCRLRNCHGAAPVVAVFAETTSYPPSAGGAAPPPALQPSGRDKIPTPKPRLSPISPKGHRKRTQNLNKSTGYHRHTGLAPSDNTLLFLSHIEEIQWRIDGGREGRLMRISHSAHHIEILREIDRHPTQSSYFLRFAEPVEDLERQHAAVAFELEALSEGSPTDASGPLAERFRIVPAKQGRVAAFFTAAKETSNLRFHLHAPFVPELSRSSIKDTPANTPLFRQLAKLTARSLFLIRDLGLLDRDFLAVLPNSQDELPTAYHPVLDAIIKTMNRHPLTPKHSGGHAPADQLLQAEAGLKALLTREDIRLLTKGHGDPRDWAIAATQRNNRVDRLLHDLDIGRWGVEQFVDVLDKECSNRYRYCASTNRWIEGPDPKIIAWLSRKPDDWLCALYALFYQHLKKKLFRFSNICIVRLSNGDHTIGRKSYFPTLDITDDTIHPLVLKDTYSGGRAASEQSARDFLEGIGVREVGELQEIEAILEQRYAEHITGPTWDIHKNDLKRFIAFIEKNRNKVDLFKHYYIFQRSDQAWSKPDTLYFDTPYLDTGLHAYFKKLDSKISRMPLSETYCTFDMLPQFIYFARMCGVTDQLEIAKVRCCENPDNKYLYGASGTMRWDTGKDNDFTIPKLGELLDNPDIGLSRLVWNTLCKNSNQNEILCATIQKNRSHQPRYAASQLVHHLRRAEWIPQRDGSFVSPADASQGLLPEGFQFDPGWRWLAALNFGIEVQKSEEKQKKILEVANELGFSDEAALADARRFAALNPEIRNRVLAEHEQPIDLPRHEPKDRNRRAMEIHEEALGAADRVMETRPRSVAVNRDSNKRERTDPYLRNMYTNSDGVTYCQACKDCLPFKSPDGKYFFEDVEFLPDLKKHYYQNYLALCPNHAAMFRYANDDRDKMMEKFVDLDSDKLTLTLAGEQVEIYFTYTHIQDLVVVIKVDNGY